MGGALSGLRIVEVAAGWAAPLCGNLLMGLGASVTKVAPPGGDYLRRTGPRSSGTSAAYDLVNVGKAELRLDLDRDTGRQELLAHLSEADVFLHDRTAAELARLGCAPDTLSGRNPRVVQCSVTPYGTFGPLRDWAGSELTVQAVSGLLATTGYPGGPPMRVGGLVAQGSAALAAAGAVLAAYYHVVRTGTGQQVEVAWYDATMGLLGHFAASHFIEGKRIERVGNRHPVNAPWNTYPASDGDVVICTGHRPGQWQRLCAVMGRDELVDDPGFSTTAARRADVEEVDAIVGAWTAAHTREEIIGVLEANRIPVGQVTDVAGMLRSEQAQDHRLLRWRAGVGRRVGVAGPITGLHGAPPHDVAAGPDAVAGPEVAGPEAGSERDTEARAAGAPGEGVLSGLRVVELSLGTSGPYVGRTLAALGADVIKVEPVGGEPLRHHAVRIGDQSYFFAYLNHCGKRSIEVDTGTREGREVLDALVATADVFLENFVPGALAAQALDPETLTRAHPSLVYASVSGFGDASPWRSKRAYDTVVQAMTGLMSVTGEPEREPLSSGVSLADITASSLAVVSVLAALVERARSGRGQLVDVCMFDVTAWLGLEGWAEVLATGRSPGRVGNRHWWHWPHDVFAAQDGPVAIACETEDHRRAVRSLVGAEGGKGGGGEVGPAAVPEARRQLEDQVRRWAGLRSTAAVVAQCQRAGVPAAPVLEVGDALAHPHASARSVVTEVVDVSGGHPAPALGVPLHLTETPAVLERAIGPAGFDTADVLRELGR